MTIEQAIQWCNEDLERHPNINMFGLVYKAGDTFTCETGLIVWLDQQFRLYGHDVVCYRSSKGDWTFQPPYQQQESEDAHE